MRVILAYVASLDGFLVDATGRQSFEWASAEDQERFRQLVMESGTVVIGSNTYEKHKRLLIPTPGLRRIVMTHHAEKYASDAQEGTLEFSSLTPAELVASLERQGVSQLLVAAGPTLYSQFFKAGLITELQVTVEPLLFGAGIPAASGIPSTTRLELIDTERLNTSGTLLLKYKVVYPVR